MCTHPLTKSTVCLTLFLVLGNHFAYANESHPRIDTAHGTFTFVSVIGCEHLFWLFRVSFPLSTLTLPYVCPHAAVFVLLSLLCALIRLSVNISSALVRDGVAQRSRAGPP